MLTKRQVTVLVLTKNRHTIGLIAIGRIFDDQVTTQNRLHTRFTGMRVENQTAENIVQIGQAQGADALLFHSTDSRVKSHGTVSHRKLGVHAKMDELRLHNEAFLQMDQMIYFKL